MAGTDSGTTFLKSLSCFGPRSRELTGAEDLVAHYGLQELYEQFCKKPLPVAIADSNYLQHVVGDIEIRKGEGMEFGQLIAGPSNRAPVDIQPLDLQLLQWAFTLKENGPISLPEADKGVQTISGNLKGEKDKKRKKKHKKHKHREKDKDKKDKDKNHGNGENEEDRSKKHRKKKRSREGVGEEADGHKPRKKKQKSSLEAEVPGVTKNGK